MYRLSATDTKGQCFRKCIASTKISNEHSSSCLVQTNYSIRDHDILFGNPDPSLQQTQNCGWLMGS